mgnify:CR=1 FL=1
MNQNKKIKYTNLPIINKGKIYKENENENKNTKFITGILIIFIIIILMFSGYSMAKIIDEVIIKGKAQIAEPILVIENNPSIDITEAKNYGEYIFKVKNYNEENKISEVDLKYYIEVLSNSEESINVELYQNENKIELIDNKTEYIQISKENKEEREYKIKITYDKEKTNSLNDIMEKIQVRVHTEQEKA